MTRGCARGNVGATPPVGTDRDRETETLFRARARSFSPPLSHDGQSRPAVWVSRVGRSVGPSDSEEVRYQSRGLICRSVGFDRK